MICCPWNCCFAALALEVAITYPHGYPLKFGESVTIVQPSQIGGPWKKNNSANPLPSADCRCCRPFLDLLSRRTNSLLVGPSVPRPTLGFPEPSSDDQKPKVGDNGEAGRHCKDWDLFDKAHLEVGEVGEVGVETRAQSTTSLNASKMVRSMDTPLEVLIVKYYYIIYSKIPAANILPSRLVY